MHDLAIVGAGPVGATLALALAEADLDVVALDARSPGQSLRGERSLAISHGTRLIFERLGVWPALASADGAVTAIERIDVSQAGGFGVAALDAADGGWPALGYVVSYHALQRALDAAVARAGVAVRYGTTVTAIGGTPAYAAVTLEGERDVLLARLAAVADGTGAAVAGVERIVHDYGQHALLAKLWTAWPHRGVAYERFTGQGPIALLPEGDHYGLVWTLTPERARAMLELDDGPFLAALATQFGTRVTGFLRVADRRAFPLVLEYSRPSVSRRAVALGNAAQTLHPVAGQGFNLGVRDAYELARAVLEGGRDAIGTVAMLDAYARGRRPDRLAGIAFTHGLVQLFGTDAPLLRWPRGAALALLDLVPAAKRALTRAIQNGLH